MVLRFITREEWGAEPPKLKRFLETPVENVAEDHWAPLTFNKWHLHPTCNTEEECKERVRLIQTIAFEKRQSDLNYNFLIGGDGNVYEGRGWATLLTEDSLWSGIVIGYIGKFTVEGPAPEHMRAKFEELVRYGKDRHFIKDDAIIFKLNQTRLEPSFDDDD